MSQFVSSPSAPGKKRSLLTVAIGAAIAMSSTNLTFAQDYALEEIVVTAQKREQSLQSVPIAISAFSANQLQDMGAESLNDLGAFTPGLETDNTDVNQSSYTIRGINTNDFGSGSDPAVAVYVDGVYSGRGASAPVNFSDVERVEVLKGPQGTLFGRNAAAGAIHIITKDPSDETDGYLGLQIGDYNKRKIQGGFNVTLAEDVYARFSFRENTRDGYINNTVGSSDLSQEDDNMVTAAVLWEASPDTEVVFRAEYSEMDKDGPQATSFTLSDDLYDNFAIDYPGFEARDLGGASVTVAHDVGDFTFTSITAFRTFNAHQSEDEDGTDLARFYLTTDTIDEQEQYSQEFRVNYVGDRLKYTVGASWFKEDIEQTYLVDATVTTLDTFFLIDAGVPVEQIELLPEGAGLSGFLGAAIAPQINAQFAQMGLPIGMDTADVLAATGANLGQSWHEEMHNIGNYESIAAYADMTYSITDRLDLSLGVRWTKDDKDFHIDTSWINAFQIPTLTGPFGSQPTEAYLGGPMDVPFGLVFFEQIDDDKSDSWSSVTPRVVLDYKLNEDVMVFASVAEGFKAGGFNSLGDDPSFSPEEVLNMELGLKSTLMDGRMRFNASIYQYDYDNLQILKLSGPAGVIPTYNIKNADAEGQGLELELQWLITEKLFLAANYSHTETEYTSYSLFEGETALDDLTGEPLSDMPENKVNISLEYTTDLAEAYELVVRGDYNYTDERTLNAGIDPSRVIDDYSLLNARAILRSNESDWEAALYINNAFDEEYLYGIGGTGEGIGSPVADRGKPRTFGIDLMYRF